MGFFDIIEEIVDDSIDRLKARAKDGNLGPKPSKPFPPEEFPDLAQKTGRHERQVIHDQIAKKSETLGEIDQILMNLEQTMDNLKEGSDPKNMLVELLSPENNPDKGSHIAVWRGVYFHHGIYVGDNSVYHYKDGEIRKDSLSTFRDWGKVRVIKSPKKYSAKKIIERAKFREGEAKYNLIFNNCEHYVVWCRSGKKL